MLYREGEVLALDGALQVDFQELLSEARRAQSLASKDLGLATAVARGAMARYRGELLPDDRYDDWAEKPRQQAKLVMLELLDLCATEAARRGDLDALRRAVERTIEFAPYDDVRYLPRRVHFARAGSSWRSACRCQPGSLCLRTARPGATSLTAGTRAVDCRLSGLAPAHSSYSGEAHGAVAPLGP